MRRMGLLWELVKQTLRMGTTTKWGMVKGAKGVTGGYLLTLMGRLRSEAFLQTDEAMLRNYAGNWWQPIQQGGRWPLNLSAGLASLLRASSARCLRRTAWSVIARMVEEHFGGPSRWIRRAGSTLFRFPVLMRTLLASRSWSGSGRDWHRALAFGDRAIGAVEFQGILYGYGNQCLSQLCAGVREARLKVLQPEEYEGEWDVDLTDEVSGASAVGEVEGRKVQ